MPRSKSPIQPLAGLPGDYLDIVTPAAARGDLAALKTYVRIKPEFVRVVGPHGRTLLWEAARKGRVETVDYLLQADAEVERRGCYFRDTMAELSPWAIALNHGHHAVAELLQRHGTEDRLESACYRGDLDRVNALLIEQPQAVDQPITNPETSDGSFPVHYAIAANHLDIFDRLVESGADVRRDGARLMAWAIYRDATAIGERLLALGARPSAGDANEACQDPGWRPILSRHGFRFDVNAPNDHGFPPLVEACRGNHNSPDSADCVLDLLNSGAEVGIRDHKGKTALHRAAQAGFLETIAVLMDAGADLNAADAKGETPLFDAVRAGRPTAVADLLARGADDNHQNRMGQTAEFLAQRSSKPAAKDVRALLAKRGISG